MNNAKIIHIAILIILFSASQAFGESITKSLVFMPNGYSYEETREFIKSIVNNELQNEIFTTFPNIKNQKGSFRYTPAFTKSLVGAERGNAVLVKLKGFDNWNKKSQYFDFLVSYVRNKAAVLPKKSI